jgi:hypothetical protein
MNILFANLGGHIGAKRLTLTRVFRKKRLLITLSTADPGDPFEVTVCVCENLDPKL